MAISVDYTVYPYKIELPKADLTLDTGTQYYLTVDTYWNLLSDYSDSEESLPFPLMYSRIPATATTPSITEINTIDYVLEFESGFYSVNIINGNTNIREVEVKNPVSVSTNNTAGFVSYTSGSGVTEQDKIDIAALSATDVWADTDATQLIADMTFVKDIEGGKWKIEGTQMIFYKDDNTTEVARFNIDDVDAPKLRTRV